MTRRVAKIKASALATRSAPNVPARERPARVSPFLRLAQFVLSWRRFGRILLVAVLALVVTVAVSPLVDWVYMTFFFSEATIIAPSLVSTAAGVVMYLAGWVLLVGTVGQPPMPRRATLVYLLVGILAVLLVAYLVIQGYSIVAET